MVIDPALLGAFALAVSALVISPGPDTALILRNAMVSGRRAGIATVAGAQAGLIVHTLLAVLGLSVVIVSVPALYRGIAVAGAAYLAWLGIMSFRAAPLQTGSGGAAIGTIRAAREAMITNLLNPKVVMLYLALMPNFIVPGRGAVPGQLALLGATLIAVNVLWQLPLALMANGIRAWLARPAIQRGVARSMGAVLLFFAAALLLEHLR